MGFFDWLGPTSWTKQRAPLDVAPRTAPSIKSIPISVTLPPELTTRSLVYGFSGASPYGLAADETNSAVFACLQAIAVAIAEPPLTVYRRDPAGNVRVDDAEISRLFDRPNPHMSIDSLLSYTVTSLHVSGNAYWRKLRAGDPENGAVAELWPIAPHAISPYTAPQSDQFISYYRYGSEEIAPANIVHFRYGLDDRDHRLGLAPLARLYREIMSDAQATRYAERLLANLAINGLTLSFDKDAQPISQEMADQLKARIQSTYGGDNVGSVSVLSPGAELSALGFSPEQMDLKTLHRVPEERIAAVLGVPAIVAGLGAGLDRSTYSNFREARETFTETKLLPLWASLAGVITLQLLPDFSSDGSLVIEFDTTDVRALSDDQNATAERLKVLVEAGILTKDEARAEIGYEPLPEQEAEPEPEQAPQPILAMPGAASRLYTVKAAEDLPRRYDHLRLLSLPTWERELIVYLIGQERRTLRRLDAGADTAEDLVPEGESVLLTETLTPLQLAALGDISRLVMAELSVAFQVDDPLTRQYLAAAGQNISGITSTTREAVRAALVEGQQAGEGIPELAKRLRALPSFDRPRAVTVARTELGHATSTASLASYRASGVVVGIRVHDGDHDAACRAMDGRTFRLDEALPATLGHPNCVRAFAPLTDMADIARSA